MIKRLKWDSEFFGCEIGQFKVLKNWNEAEFMALARKFDLVYIESGFPIKFNWRYEEVKMVYSKKVKTITSVDGIQFYKNGQGYEYLLSLAYKSGHESRFIKDSFFGVVNFKRLYKKWLDKNLSDPHNHVLVKVCDNRIVGFISYTDSAPEAKIELIAVDELYRGKKIGKELIEAVENNLKPDTVLLVPTQGSNSVACSFYEKIGFDLLEKKYFYHYDANPI